MLKSFAEAGIENLFESEGETESDSDRDSASIQLTAGKNVKSHCKDHKGLLEAVLNKEYPKFKDSNNAEEFLNDLSEMINNGTLKYAYKSTAMKGCDVLSLYI